MTTLNLPANGGRREPLTLSQGSPREVDSSRWNRIAYAATHVVADPLADIDPWLEVAIDWDRTLAFREYLWDLGFGVAEAMDTAQRGGGVDWPASLMLIQKTAAAAKARGEWRLIRGMASWSRRTVLAISLCLGAAALAVVMLAGGGEIRLVFAAAILALPFSALSGVYQAAVRGLGFVVSGQVPDTLVRALTFLTLVGAAYLAFGAVTPASAAGMYSGATFAAD